MEYLIPESYFVARSTWMLLLLLAGGVILIAKGADWLVEGAVALSERMRVPKVIIGATVVSLGTTTPEAAVSVMAAVHGESGLALGNSVGSIICDTGMIFGICCLVTRLPMDRFVLNRHGWIQFGAGVLLVVVSVACYFLDPVAHEIPRVVGFVFIGLLVAYMLMSIRWARDHAEHQPMQHGLTGEELAERAKGKPIVIEVIWLLIGLTCVLLASRVLICSVSELCFRWGVPSSVVAVTLVAFGTSLPELVTAITSIRKGHRDLVVGNIIGADVLNVFFVTGAAACATPLTVDRHFLVLDFPIMIAVLALFRLTVKFSKGETFARWPGFLFLALYVIFLAGIVAMNAGGGLH